MARKKVRYPAGRKNLPFVREHLRGLAVPVPAWGTGDSFQLREMERLTSESEKRCQQKFVVANELSRSLVSFQANRGRAVYRWYRFKEAFSAGLVEYFLERYRLTSGVLLDPFAGSGTALFAAAAFGMDAEGVELLPVGQAIIEARQLVECGLDMADENRLVFWVANRPWRDAKRFFR